MPTENAPETLDHNLADQNRDDPRADYTDCVLIKRMLDSEVLTTETPSHGVFP